MERKKRNHYAWLWSFGVCTDGDSGAPIGRLHVFASKAARDRWVTEAAHVPRSQGGHREPCPSTWQRYDGEPVEHGPAGDA